MSILGTFKILIHCCTLISVQVGLKVATERLFKATQSPIYSLYDLTDCFLFGLIRFLFFCFFSIKNKCYLIQVCVKKWKGRGKKLLENFPIMLLLRIKSDKRPPAIPPLIKKKSIVNSLGN